ncbi:MAG: hypothetical protein KAT58_06025 [candidate division Zixibacteria bacterium]|nr:hypothetical protein [candidate division Zixibacteria bacterium]
MYWFNFNHFRYFERPNASPWHLNEGIASLVYSSVNPRVKVDSLNPETGEYRIVLQGTLDFDRTWNTDRY